MNLTPQAAVQEMATFSPEVEAEKHLTKYPADRIRDERMKFDVAYRGANIS